MRTITLSEEIIVFEGEKATRGKGKRVRRKKKRERERERERSSFFSLYFVLGFLFSLFSRVGHNNFHFHTHTFPSF